MIERRAVFVDTSAWFALAATGDANHAVAARLFPRMLAGRGTVTTTNHVISESFTLARRRLGSLAALEFLRRIRATERIRRVFVPESWEAEAERLLERYDDQPFSYVDATSFVAMRRLGIHEAFAFDRDFLAAGFTLVTDAQFE
ncbi:MAG: PIN domain-containing protein [Chloroflexota bacterium]